MASATPELNCLFHEAVLSLCKSCMTRALIVDARDLNLFSTHVCTEPSLPDTAEESIVTSPPCEPLPSRNSHGHSSKTHKRLPRHNATCTVSQRSSFREANRSASLALELLNAEAVLATARRPRQRVSADDCLKCFCANRNEDAAAVKAP